MSNELKLNKTLEQWSKVDSAYCASENSDTANMFLIQDAQSDIKTLGNRVSELEKEIEFLTTIRDILNDNFIETCNLASEFQKLLEEVLSEVPHGWGESFSESDLAQRIREALEDDSE